ncbi:MAG TPA: hypothetical protein VNM69_10295 [Bacillus sp. (in: firmicutes)]|uniref:hypothetical protein n=1 Tax=Bacillus litorisediminis TaxID=2922713 RepID=UPI001FAE1600|nr:hypothetical protein [Bacillus litorisediminis]HWO76269.1 hypothetical protein [Bacillus sp. (in: firmicutes)]
MKPILQLNETMRTKVQSLESECERICKKLVNEYNHTFSQLGVTLNIELVRTRKHFEVSQDQLFSKDYHSFIEIGIEKNNEYFTNSVVSIWKCKEEWFNLVGFITENTAEKIEQNIREIIQEMIHDLKESY